MAIFSNPRDCDKYVRDHEKYLKKMWASPLLSVERGAYERKAQAALASANDCRARAVVAGVRRGVRDVASDIRSGAQDVAEGLTGSNGNAARKKNAKLLRDMQIMINSIRTLSDARKAESRIRIARGKNYISTLTSFHLLSSLRAKRLKVLNLKGFSRLTQDQKVKLLLIRRKVLLGQLHATHAKTLAAQVAPSVKEDWADHAAAAEGDASVAAVAAAAAPELVAAASADAAAATATTTFEASAPSTVTAAYSEPAAAAATVLPEAAAATVLPEAEEASDFPVEEGLEEGSEGNGPNLKLIAGVALAGLGVWYFFLRSSSTTVVVR